MTLRRATYHRISRRLLAESRHPGSTTRFSIRESLYILHRGSR